MAEKPEEVHDLPDFPSVTRKMILGLAQYARTLEEDSEPEVDATKPRLCHNL